MKNKAIVSLTLLCLLVANSTIHAKQATKRNVLLISVDDLNDWVGCMGGHPQAKTPAIDSLAKRGTLFANAHCQSPVCNPSRASLLTGRYPHSTGIYFLSPGYQAAPVLKGVKTLPERFADDGYAVMGVGKIFHSRGNQVFNKVGEYGGSMGGFGPRPKKKISQPHGHPLWDWGAFPDSDKQMPDYNVANWAIERLEKDYDKPFFLAVGFWRPHVPMFAPKKWFDLHPRDQIKLPAIIKNDNGDISRYAWDLTNLKHVSPTHKWVKEAKQWEHAVQSYLASTSFVDHQLGRVLAALEKSSHRDNTVIVLFADHGFHLGEKERWAKRTLWEDGTRVPLIVVDPARKGGQVSTRPAELIDIFPTLLALNGLKPDPTQEGQSLTPLLDDPNADNWNHPAITSFGPGNHAVRSERYRYIHYNDGSEEFYDHSNDPHEWNNLIAPGKTVSAGLAAIVKHHRAQLPKKEHALLPGGSTGHNAFKAAEANRENLKPTAKEQTGSQLPKVLLIGDSISIGYTPHVIAAMKKDAVVKHHRGNAQHTGTGLKQLHKWLGKEQWDVIHFNWGLWDLCYRHPDSKVQGKRDKVNGKVTTSLDQYEKNLEQLVIRLKKTNSKLIWAHTTVVPKGEAGRIVGDDVKYNAIAAKIMKKHGVAINDLHALTSGFDKDLFTKPGDVHYKPIGSRKIGNQVAAAIRTAVGK